MRVALPAAAPPSFSNTRRSRASLRATAARAHSQALNSDRMSAQRPKLLVSNDDGINAPGIRALTQALIKADCFDVYVCAPSGERSAQSHAITLGRYLQCAPGNVAGAAVSFAVDGTPADSVMLALNSNLLGQGGQEFDLVLSGINRGDNCGLHVIYSGTVGAAREAACKGIPSIAFSLDNHQARNMADYAISAAHSVSLVKAMLGMCPGQDTQSPPAKRIVNAVVNVNFPSNQIPQQGFYLTHQSQACVFPAFKEVQEPTGPHLDLIDEHTPDSRVFRNFAGAVQSDFSEGGDAWAVRHGWVSVCPLGLRQDLLAIQPTAATTANGNGNGSPAPHAVEHHSQVSAVIAATSEVVTAAAKDAQMTYAGVSNL